MILTRDHLLELCKSFDKLYLVLEDESGEIQEKRKLIEYGKETFITAEKDNMTPIIIDQYGNKVYTFRKTIDNRISLVLDLTPEGRRIRDAKRRSPF